MNHRVLPAQIPQPSHTRPPDRWSGEKNTGESTISETADLFSAGLKCLTAGDLDGYLNLFSDDVDYAFPFAPSGRPDRVTGRDNLRGYLQPIFSRATYEDMKDLVVYETDVPDTIVAEYTIVLRFLEGDRLVSGRYIVVVHSVNGKVDSYRDYWNPLAMGAPAEKAKAA